MEMQKKSYSTDMNSTNTKGTTFTLSNGRVVHFTESNLKFTAKDLEESLRVFRKKVLPIFKKLAKE